MNESPARRADASKIARRRGRGNVVSHIQGGRPRCLATNAVKVTRRTRLFGHLPAILEEPGQLQPVYQLWLLTINWRKPLLNPRADRVLVSSQKPSGFFNGVIAMDPHEPVVWMAAPHLPRHQMATLGHALANVLSERIKIRRQRG